MKNLEIKAKISNLQYALDIAATLTGNGFEEIYQTDTYFNIHEGRLKLRKYGDIAELIFYKRPDGREPEWSNYLISEVKSPIVIKEILESIHGVKTVVKKRRRLFLLENTRIHIDEVDNLGIFLEFEVVTNENTNPDDSRKTIDMLISEFGIEENDLIEASYCDLQEELDLKISKV